MGAPYLYSQLGTAAEVNRNLCFDAQVPADPRQLIPFGLSYDDLEVKAFTSSAGSPLVLKIRSQAGGKDEITARFVLPGNSPDVLPLIDPCVKLIEAEKQRILDAIVVSCPVLPNKNLQTVDVLVGPAMKKLPPDPDNDIGVAWVLPKVSKAHPVRPKLTLSCAYADANAASDKRPITEKKQLPIPVSAGICNFDQGSATCSK